MIWIIGEYADRIDGSKDLLDGFVDNFKDEPAEVFHGWLERRFFACDSGARPL